MTYNPTTVSIDGTQYHAVIQESGAVVINSDHAILDRIGEMVNHFNTRVAEGWQGAPIPDAVIALHVFAEINAAEFLEFTASGVYASAEYAGNAAEVAEEIARITSLNRIRDCINNAYRTLGRRRPGEISDTYRTGAMLAQMLPSTDDQEQNR